MFPEPTLPYTPLTSLNAARRATLSLFKPAEKAGLDEVPSGRIIGITVWECPDTVLMVRHQRHRINPERVTALHVAKRRPQDVHSLGQQPVAVTFRQGDGKEPCSPDSRVRR